MAVGLVLVGLVGPRPAGAQPRRAVVIVTAAPGAPAVGAGRLATWRTHVERAARTAGYRVVGDPTGWAEARAEQLGGILPRRVAGFEALEQLLVDARRAAASLQEGRALALLSRAERVAEDHADVAGAAAWLAEVETAMGITAAQAGLDGLTEAALSRAATLDSSRGVRAAEAPPSVVARADAIGRAVATRPVGSFEVRAEAPDARVFLDDEELGPAPRLVRAPVGRHVLRVEAPGHLPWGRVVEVLEGRRPDVAVRLSPDPLVAAARRLERAAGRGELAAVADALGALDGVGTAWVAEVGGGPQDRALLTLCDGDGCAAVRRLEVDEVPIVLQGTTRQPAADVAAELVDARPWLARSPPAPPPPPPPTPWWRRWYVLAGAAAVVGAGVGAVVLLTRPEPEQRFRVILDTSEL